MYHDFQEPEASTIGISQGGRTFKFVEFSNGKPLSSSLNVTLRKRIRQIPKSKGTSTKEQSKSKTMKSKRIGLRKMRKRLGTILTVIANCQTLNKKNSEQKCQNTMRKYILKFMKGVSTNLFKYILWVSIQFLSCCIIFDWTICYLVKLTF